MATLSADQQSQALALAREGTSIKKILKSIACHSDTLYGTLEHDLTFRERFARARDQGLDELADDLLDVIELDKDVQLLRLQSDNIKWLLARRASKRYGDKLDINITERIDIGGALIEARKRTSLQPVCNLEQSPDVQSIEYTDITPIRRTGNQSVSANSDDGSAWDVFE